MSYHTELLTKREKHFHNAAVTNASLNRLGIYIDKMCVLCKRQYPATILNIEEHIHHGTEYRCLDQGTCRWKQRRL